MFPDKVPAVLFDLFTNLPELFHDLFLTAFRPCRIGKIMMEFLGVGREIRTVLAGIVTDADHKVKIDASVFIDRKSVVKGKSVSVSVDLGGSSIIKKKKKY